MSRITIAGLALLCAMPLAAQTRAASVTLMAPPRINDTTDHVDLLVADQSRLQIIIKDYRGRTITRPVSWKSSAPMTAYVVGGVVTAKAVGTARISATVDGITRSVMACVAPEKLHELEEPAPDTIMIRFPSTGTRVGTVQAGKEEQMVRILPMVTRDPVTKAALAKACIHWVLAVGPQVPVLDTNVITMTRRGVVTLKTPITEFYISASWGPQIPLQGLVKAKGYRTYTSGN